MSYLMDAIAEAEAEFSETANRAVLGPVGAFNRGLVAGFSIAVKAYGIWKDGRQRIGCMDTPVGEAILSFRKALAEQ